MGSIIAELTSSAAQGFAPSSASSSASVPSASRTEVWVDGLTVFSACSRGVGNASDSSVLSSSDTSAT